MAGAGGRWGVDDWAGKWPPICSACRARIQILAASAVLIRHLQQFFFEKC
jgi:hypothetical protein